MEETSFYPETNVIILRKILPLKNGFISQTINVLNFFYENVNNSDNSKVYLTNVVPWERHMTKKQACSHAAAAHYTSLETV